MPISQKTEEKLSVSGCSLSTHFPYLCPPREAGCCTGNTYLKETQIKIYYGTERFGKVFCDYADLDIALPIELYMDCKEF